MVYFKGAEKTELRDYFLDEAILHTLSETELTEKFLDYLHGNIAGRQIPTYRDSLSEYDGIINEANTELGILKTLGRANPPAGTPGTPPAPSAPTTPGTPTPATHLSRAEIDRIKSQEDRYTNNKIRAETAKEELEKRAEALAQETTKWALELRNLGKDLEELTIDPTAVQYNFDIKTFEEATFSTVAGKRNPDFSVLENAFATYDYENNGKVLNNLKKLEGSLGGNYSLRNINNKRSEVKPIIDELKTTRTSLQTSAKNDIQADFKKYDAEVTEKYKEAKKNIKGYFVPTGNLNQSWLNVVRNYGKKLVNGVALKDNEKKNKDYKTLSNAYLNLKIGEAYGNPDHIENELTRIDAMTSRKDALKEIIAFQEDLESVKDGVLETLNEELKDAYKNVIMGSSLDDRQNNTGEFDWFMFSKDDKIVENHNLETYAQGGIGMFQEMFLTDPDSEAEFWNLQDDVVKKHKRASSWLYGGFFNRKKNNKIGVGEVLKLGLGYSVYFNHSDDIADELNYTWRDIRDLHALGASNTIEEILGIYHEASKLGEKVNDTAADWTKRENSGYDALDNQINNLSGWSFRIVDDLWDFVGSKIEGFKKPDVTTAYQVDITAIKPKYHPHLQTLLGGIGAGAILTMTADEIIKHVGSDESITDKIKHTLGPIGEMTKEAGIAGIMHKAMEPKAK